MHSSSWHPMNLNVPPLEFESIHEQPFPAPRYCEINFLFYWWFRAPNKEQYTSASFTAFLNMLRWPEWSSSQSVCSAILELCSPFCDMQLSYCAIRIRLQWTGSELRWRKDVSSMETESHYELHCRKFPCYHSTSTCPFSSIRLVCRLLHVSPLQVLLTCGS